MSSIEERLDRIEKDIAYLKGVVEQMDKRVAELREYVDKRFEVVDRRFNHVETELRELRTELGGLRAELNNRFLWLLGIQISMWITIILTILFRR